MLSGPLLRAGHVCSGDVLSAALLCAGRVLSGPVLCAGDVSSQDLPPAAVADETLPSADVLPNHVLPNHVLPDGLLCACGLLLRGRG